LSRIRRRPLSALAALALTAAAAFGQGGGREDLAEKVEADRLRADPLILLDGAHFPDLVEMKTRFGPALRTFYASADVPAEGDGSETKPWKDVQKALCRLKPGDRLVLEPGVYPGRFVIGEGCADGSAGAPIQVFGQEAFLHGGSEKAPLITMTRAHWQLWDLELVLGENASAGVLVTGPSAHDVLLDDLHAYEGPGSAIRIEGGSSRVTVANGHIHQTAGIVVTGPARDVTITRNKIHHNFGTSVTLKGAPRASIENVTVSLNKLHNDKGRALDLSGVRGVRANMNKIYNYRPAGSSPGEAIRVGPDARDVIIENSFVAEATVGVRIGEAGKPPPMNVVVRRNYLENRLTHDSVAFDIAAGHGVGVFNNTIDRYAEAFRGPTVSGAGERLAIANNLILDPSSVALRFPRAEALSVLDYNVFSRPDGKVRAQIGEILADLEAHRAAGRMAHSRVEKHVELTDRDLAKLVPASPFADTGKAFGAITFKGRAPDIGVAEK
jgi:parallel beta helix pectate lyase-like protein